MAWGSSQKRFKPVHLNLVLIHQHWIRESINVPATSCNQVIGERNMGRDNDSVHLLPRWLTLPLLCPYLRFVCCIMARRKAGRVRVTPARRCAHRSIIAKAIWLLSKFLSPFKLELIKKIQSRAVHVGGFVRMCKRFVKEVQQTIYIMKRWREEKIACGCWTSQRWPQALFVYAAQLPTLVGCCWLGRKGLCTQKHLNNPTHFKLFVFFLG